MHGVESPGNEAMRASIKEVKGEMRTMDCIMAAPCGGATELTRRSANCVLSAMETGEVGTTSDVTIIGETETCRVRHEGTTEDFKEVTDGDADNKIDKGRN